jgi:hypothetical protein
MYFTRAHAPHIDEFGDIARRRSLASAHQISRALPVALPVNSVPARRRRENLPAIKLAGGHVFSARSSCRSRIPAIFDSSVRPVPQAHAMPTVSSGLPVAFCAALSNRWRAVLSSALELAPLLHCTTPANNRVCGGSACKRASGRKPEQILPLREHQVHRSADILSASNTAYKVNGSRHTCCSLLKEPSLSPQRGD